MFQACTYSVSFARLARGRDPGVETNAQGLHTSLRGRIAKTSLQGCDHLGRRWVFVGEGGGRHGNSTVWRHRSTERIEFTTLREHLLREWQQSVENCVQIRMTRSSI